MFVIKSLCPVLVKCKALCRFDQQDGKIGTPSIQKKKASKTISKAVHNQKRVGFPFEACG